MIATCGPLDGAKQETNLTIHACTLYDFFVAAVISFPFALFFSAVPAGQRPRLACACAVTRLVAYNITF